MYQSTSDPYCYPGTTVLKNRANVRDQAALDAFEHEATLQRSEEPYPAGRLTVSHYKAIHRHLFQDVYAWAGRFRTVRIAKDDSMFCYPEHIGAQLRQLFARLQRDRCLADLTAEDFAAKAAHFLTELNAIHPFREGNGRTQLAFLALLADKAGHPLDIHRIEPEPLLKAMVASFHTNEAPLATMVRSLLGK